MVRSMMLLAALLTAGVAEGQERPRAPPADPRTYWPPAGRVGVAALVASRTGGCRLSFILLNNTETQFRDITLTVEIARSATLGTITDVTFRFVDPGRLRDADAWAMRGCERQPRVQIRAALCSTGALAYRECLGLFTPVSPPARDAERARITIGQD